MVANKEYALAGKFFEYFFEPVLAHHSSLFYNIDFHKFVATLLHVSSRGGDPHANGILRDFAEMMRNLDAKQLESVLSYLDNLEQSDPMGKILAFACCHRKRIEEEIRSVSESGPVANWSLELSMTALNWLLASWGEEFEVLEVYCDESKPIQEAQEFFKVFIGREDKAYIRLGSEPTPSIIYNLSGPINLVDSKDSHGIQIADVLSSSLAYALKNPDEENAKKWLSLLEDVPANQLKPDLNQVDLTQEGAFINTMVLGELVDRSVRGQNLFESMPDIILSARSIFLQYVHETALNTI